MPKKAISSETRAKIKGYLEGFVENVVRDYKGRPVPALDTPSAYLAKSSVRGQ